MIKNKRQFVSGIIAACISILCLIAVLVNGFYVRFLITAFISAIWALISMFWAYKTNGIEQEIMAITDERDRYITMKSCHTTLKIMNYVLWGGSLVLATFYGLFKAEEFIVASLTLCIVIVIMFIITILTESHYEKTE